ncbi:hypothetical protein OROMI_000930 [Orobanche minor]
MAASWRWKGERRRGNENWPRSPGTVAEARLVGSLDRNPGLEVECLEMVCRNHSLASQLNVEFKMRNGFLFPLKKFAERMRSFVSLPVDFVRKDISETTENGV